LVTTPELAAEVTLQPVRRFGFDAAILFSDILVIPDALGQRYHFRDGGGIQMESAVRTAADVARLDPNAVEGCLSYTTEAIRLVKQALAGQHALIGFAGSPWTLANFMLQGGSTRNWVKALELFQSDRPLFEELMNRLTRAVTKHLRQQIAAGAEAVQVFDTLGWVAGEELFEAVSAKYLREIVGGLKRAVPVIIFAKGVNNCWGALASTGAQVLGVDWTVRLCEVQSRLPHQVGVQGNLDPALLTASPAQVAAATRAILEDMRGRRGHIFNLGHGVPPLAKLENIAALVQTVRDFP
jgi:uroporphyrinogen decarboxylase